MVVYYTSSLATRSHPVSDGFCTSTSVLPFCLTQVKGDRIWQGGVGRDGLHGNRRKVAVAQQCLSQMIDAVIQVYPAILGRNSHRMGVIIPVEMFPDCIQTMKTVENVGAAVKAVFGDPVIAGHLREGWTFRILVEEFYFRIFQTEVSAS